MSIVVESKFVVEIVYNGITKAVEVEPEEQVTALLRKAIAAFGITQNAHLLSLYRLDGNVVPDNESVKRAGLKRSEFLLLRPNQVKGGTGLLRVREDIVDRTFRTLRTCGKGRYECVVYWTGPAAESIVDGVEHPVHERSPVGYVIDDKWLTDFWKGLGASCRSIRAQVHTHPGRAFHSATDDEWPIVSQSGFLSIVIPNFASDASSLENVWVGRLRPDGKWQALTFAGEGVTLA